jgi:hypothetical protein
MEGNEELYLRETVPDEEKEPINGLNNKYKVVLYGLYGKICNYVVKEINICNIENRFTYPFINIFEIIKQYNIDPRPSGDDEELDSRLEDMVNGIWRKRKKNS